MIGSICQSDISFGFDKAKMVISESPSEGKVNGLKRAQYNIFAQKLNNRTVVTKLTVVKQSQLCGVNQGQRER